MDSSMFDGKCTLIPEWVKNDLFKIKDIYPYKSRKNPQSRVEIQYCHPGGRKTEHIGGLLPLILRGEKTSRDYILMTIS